MNFLRLLNPDSQDAKSLSADLTLRSVGDAVLSQQDEKSILATLETLRKNDKAIVSRIPGSFRSFSGEEGLWESAKKRARSTSDSQFLLGIKSIAVDHYLHDAAIDIERTAYDSLTKQVDTSVSVIGRHILVMQKQERDNQVQRDVDAEEAREIQILWSKFVHRVKGVSSQNATSLSASYVPYGVRNGLTVQNCAGVQLSTSTTLKSENHPSPGVCLDRSYQPDPCLIHSNRDILYQWPSRVSTRRRDRISHSSVASARRREPESATRLNLRTDSRSRGTTQSCVQRLLIDCCKVWSPVAADLVYPILTIAP